MKVNINLSIIISPVINIADRLIQCHNAVFFLHNVALVSEGSNPREQDLVSRADTSVANSDLSFPFKIQRELPVRGFSLYTIPFQMWNKMVWRTIIVINTENQNYQRKNTIVYR